MNDDEESEQGFKVRDRRRFDAYGNVRDPEEQDESSHDHQDNNLAGSSSDEGGPSLGNHALPPVDFSTFVLSLSTSVMMHLGQAPAPEGAVRKDLESAKHTIDILGMLEEKTRGNLTQEEEHLMHNLLYDLRMRYVQAAG